MSNVTTDVPFFTPTVPIDAPSEPIGPMTPVANDKPQAEKAPTSASAKDTTERKPPSTPSSADPTGFHKALAPSSTTKASEVTKIVVSENALPALVVEVASQFVLGEYQANRTTSDSRGAVSYRFERDGRLATVVMNNGTLEKVAFGPLKKNEVSGESIQNIMKRRAELKQTHLPETVRQAVQKFMSEHD